MCIPFVIQTLITLCRIFDGVIVACQSSKGGKLCRTVPHRHLRVSLGNMMRQVDNIVVIIHHYSLFTIHFSLRLMSSYLRIALFGRSSFLKVQPPEDGVFAVAVLNCQLRLL